MLEISIIMQIRKIPIQEDLQINSKPTLESYKPN